LAELTNKEANINNKNIIIIGVSTGGPLLLQEIFSSLPVINAAVLIVQHIYPMFDKAISERLNELSVMDVRLAEDGQRITSGTAYVAPSRKYLKLESNERIKLIECNNLDYCRSSINVAMKSLVKHNAGKIVGVVLTGMGTDGAEGITHIKNLGGATIAQDRETSVIYNMPEAAQATGSVDYVLSKEQIGSKLVQLIGR
jgi:two-component system chemotaxis response regulator CheB